jgi:hypothetical protein
MSIAYEANTARFVDVIPVDEAERLLEWLQGAEAAEIDLSACTHLHPANLQVLMSARPTITAWPADAALAAWLTGALGAVAQAA